MANDESPVFIYNYPIDINITIHLYNGEYEATILSSGIAPQIFSIELTRDAVQEINSSLQQAIEEVSNSYEEGDSLSSEALSQLATAGKNAFNRIFKEGKQLLYQVLELIRKETEITIEIASKDFFIPWELLYDGPLGKLVDISKFWGMKYVISRTIMQRHRPGAIVSPVIQSSRPKVGLIAGGESELENIASIEIPMLQELAGQNQILLIRLRSLNADQHDEELENFGHFLSEEGIQIAHLACHTRQRKTSSQPFLDIADDFSITMADFGAQEFETKENPLVILNACLTGITDTLSIKGWTSEFWRIGARGVLATEFRVPDWFAAAFIRELYKPLLSGRPIGESLWATRYHFWHEKHNPLGLAYALYSPLAIRITK